MIDDAATDPAVQRVREMLERIADALELDGQVSVTVSDDRIVGEIDGEDVGRLIGRRGHTIDAVQLLCNRAVQRTEGERRRVVVDAAGYRQRRRELLEQQADRAADRALESGNEIELEPMTAAERKIIHDRLAEAEGVETFSEGEDPDRCVIVAPLAAAED